LGTQANTKQGINPHLANRKHLPENHKKLKISTNVGNIQSTNQQGFPSPAGTTYKPARVAGFAPLAGF
jgi:hypothetical protein